MYELLNIHLLMSFSCSVYLEPHGAIKGGLLCLEGFLGQGFDVGPNWMKEEPSCQQVLPLWVRARHYWAHLLVHCQQVRLVLGAPLLSLTGSPFLARCSCGQETWESLESNTSVFFGQCHTKEIGWLLRMRLIMHIGWRNPLFQRQPQKGKSTSPQKIIYIPSKLKKSWAFPFLFVKAFGLSCMFLSFFDLSRFSVYFQYTSMNFCPLPVKKKISQVELKDT